MKQIGNVEVPQKASAAAKVIIKGAGNYSGEVEKTFTIQKATLTVKAENRLAMVEDAIAVFAIA